MTRFIPPSIVRFLYSTTSMWMLIIASILTYEMQSHEDKLATQILYYKLGFDSPTVNWFVLLALLYVIQVIAYGFSFVLWSLFKTYVLKK